MRPAFRLSSCLLFSGFDTPLYSPGAFDASSLCCRHMGIFRGTGSRVEKVQTKDRFPQERVEEKEIVMARSVSWDCSKACRANG